MDNVQMQLEVDRSLDVLARAASLQAVRRTSAVSREDQKTDHDGLALVEDSSACHPASALAPSTSLSHVRRKAAHAPNNLTLTFPAPVRLSFNISRFTACHLFLLAELQHFTSSVRKAFTILLIHSASSLHSPWQIA